jgi:hypothetical protein
MIQERAEMFLASATDLLNSWARESGVKEAESPEEICGVIDRLWSHTSTQLHKQSTPTVPDATGFSLDEGIKSQGF